MRLSKMNKKYSGAEAEEIVRYVTRKFPTEADYSAEQSADLGLEFPNTRTMATLQVVSLRNPQVVVVTKKWDKKQEYVGHPSEPRGNFVECCVIGRDDDIKGLEAELKKQ